MTGPVYRNYSVALGDQHRLSIRRFCGSTCPTWSCSSIHLYAGKCVGVYAGDEVRHEISGPETSVVIYDANRAVPKGPLIYE